MKVQVLTHYDKIEAVNVRDLRRLIASGEVLAFHRSDGWIKVGAEPIRGDGGKEYNGPERRNFRQKPLSDNQMQESLRCVLVTKGTKPEW